MGWYWSGLRLRAEAITNEILDEAFLDSLDYQLKHGGWHGAITKTDHLAEYLWKKYRVPIWKERSIVCKKMRKWWQSKPKDKRMEFNRHVCGFIVGLGSPMSHTYCALEFSINNIPQCMLTIFGKSEQETT